MNQEVLLAKAPYFHGTCLQPAIANLLKGEPLRNARPQGKCQDIMSRENCVYLTPNLEVAKLYSRLDDRCDWPLNFLRQVGHPHIFAFKDFSNIKNIFIDEDDIGWVAMDSVFQFSNMRGKSTTYNMNQSFCKAYKKRHKRNYQYHAKQTINYLLTISEEIKSRDKKLKKFISIAKNIMDGANLILIPQETDPYFWICLGRIWTPILEAELCKNLIELGANISVDGELYPYAYAYPTPHDTSKFFPLKTSTS